MVIEEAKFPMATKALQALVGSLALVEEMPTVTSIGPSTATSPVLSARVPTPHWVIG